MAYTAIKYETVTMSLNEAAEVLGIGKTTAWDLHKRGAFPVPVLQIGGKRGALRVVRAHLEMYLSSGEPVKHGTPIGPLAS